MNSNKTIIVSLGSCTNYSDSVNKPVIRINSIEGVKNSSNKSLMKNCFTRGSVKTANWFVHDAERFVNKSIHNPGTNQVTSIDDLPYPIVAKSLYGSKGSGNHKLNSVEELRDWMINKNMNNYIFETYIDYKREYRIHCSYNGIFSAFRKLRKEGTERWFFNTNNCIFKIVTPEMQSEIHCWNALENDLKKALIELKLDFAGFDVRIKNDCSEYSIIESNSAPGLLTKGTQDYYTEILKIIKQKLN